MSRSNTAFGRFAFITIPVCVVVFVVLMATFEWRMRGSATDAMQASANALATNYATLMAPAVAIGEKARVKLYASAIAADASITHVLVRDSLGAAISSVGRVTPGAMTIQAVIRVEAHQNGPPVGTLTLGYDAVGVSIGWGERLAYLAAALAILVTTLFAVTRIAFLQVVGEPLRKMTDAIRVFESVGRHAELPLEGPDELRAVMGAYNRMQAQQAEMLEQLDVHQERLEHAVAKRTEQLEAEATRHVHTAILLRRQSHHMQVTLDSITDSVLTLDTAGRVRFMNPAAARLTQVQKKTAIGKRLSTLLPLDAIAGEGAPPDLDRVHRDASSGPIGPWLARLTPPSGSVHVVELTVAPLADDEDDAVGIAVFVRDVTESRRLAARLSHQATHDPLTELPNRREFERRLSELHAEVEATDAQHALCFLDLDQFKVVNDTCGHAAGDDLLRQVGTLLRGRLRSVDLVARLGGDEFGLLLDSCSAEDARKRGEGIRAAVENFRFAWAGQSFKIGISIGIVPIFDGAGTVDELLRMADASCYVAKDEGRNRVHVHAQDDVTMARRRGEMRWVAELESAIAEERLELAFQRITPLREGEPNDWAEMLLRVRNRDDTLHSPGAFLPAAERYGMAPRIDRWLVERTVQWLQNGEASSHGVARCSVNLSGLTLSSPGFLETVLAYLDEGGIDPSQLCFEVTETAAISNFAGARHLMESLRGRGCTFALDDFGSGVSSFGYLRELPVDYLKIDGTFVQDMDTDGLDRELVRSINTIGHIMGLRTVAEYVETAEVLESLKEIGVDHAQGFHLHKPELAFSEHIAAAVDTVVRFN